MNQIGFVLITHTAPDQIVRLIRALNQVYASPSIVVHHDFDQCPLDVSSFANVQVVRPHISTQWCGYSVIRATLAGLALLYANPSPNWFALLSGACYPTKSGLDAISDLKKGGCDAYIDHQPVDPFHLENEYQRECFRRYYSWHFGLPKLDRRMMPRSLGALTSPYRANSSRCYAGSQWFTANRAVAEYILASQERYAWLGTHLRERHCPDETYFQTIVCNAPQFKVSRNNYRYVDWSAHKPHPKELQTVDLPSILESSSHFARKFVPGNPVLNQLDDVLGIDLN
jgi:hypothetical protein